MLGNENVQFTLIESILFCINAHSDNLLKVRRSGELVMPIIWRYLIGQYMKVLLLSIASFIGLLLVTRLDDIAKFAAMGSEGHLILKFSLYQIPYILPIALPISCLIASILLFQKMSTSSELTALRASGLSIRVILAPILLMALFLSLLNFYIVSELATDSHLATRRLENEIRSVNPLLLLQNPRLLKMKGAYVKVLGPFRPGESAESVVFAVCNKNQDRLNLVLIKQLDSSQEVIGGKQVSLISSINTKTAARFDHLMIENIKNFSTPLSLFSTLMRKGGWRLSEDHLRLPLLLIRYKDLSNQLKEAKARGEANGQLLQELQERINRCKSEMARRTSVAFAVFSFTIMGVAYGVNISRTRKHKGIITVIGLAALYLVCFFLGKGLSGYVYIAYCLHLIPHILMITLSTWTLKSASRGIEWA